MIVVVFCSFIAIFLTFLGSKGVLKKGLLWGFIIITTLGCIHYNYGNDYVYYMMWFQENTRVNFSVSELFRAVYNWEPGWVALNHLFKNLGFWGLVAFLNLIMNGIYYYIINKYVEKSLWPFAFSIYVLSTSLYVLNFSMMRQGLAVAIFLFAWPYIKNGKIFAFLLLVILASSFHKSAFILLPLAFIVKLKIRNGRWVAITLVIFIFSLYVSATLAPDIFRAITLWEYFFAQDSLEYYENSEILERTYGIGFLINLIPFIVGIVFLMKKKSYSETNLLIFICLLSYVVSPFGSVLTTLIRFSYYFIAYQVLAIPKMYSMIKSTSIRYSLIALFSLMLLYSYFGFFNSPTYAKAYAEFHTIFEVL